MEQHLGSTKVNRVRPVFSNNGENIRRYQQVRSLFEASGAHLIFARPVVGGAQGTEIDWFTESPDRFERLPAQRLDPQSDIAQRLKYQTNRLYAELLRFARKPDGQFDEQEYRQLCRTIDSCLEIPNWNSVCLSENGQFVLLDWGFVEEGYNSQRGLMRKLFPTRVTSATLQLLFSDNRQAVAGEVLSVRWRDPLGEYPMFSASLTSDETGRILLENVPFMAEVFIWRGTNTGVSAFKRLHIDERPPHEFYEILLHRASADMRFRAVALDDPNLPLPNLTIQFEWDEDQRAVQESDAEGRLLLPEIGLGSRVRCSVLEENMPQHPQIFVCELAAAEHLIRVPRFEPAAAPPPPFETPVFKTEEYAPSEPSPSLHFEQPPVAVDNAPRTMIFQVFRPDGHPATRARLRLNLNGQTTELTTTDGTATLYEVPLGAYVEAFAEEGNCSERRNFLQSDRTGFYKIHLKKKKGCAWWWLLLLLLLLGAAAAWYFWGQNNFSNALPTTQEQGQIKIKVIDANTQQPIEAAEVQISGQSAPLLTDTAGQVFIGSFESGKTFKVRVVKQDYGEESRTLTTATQELIIPIKQIKEGGLRGQRGDFSITLKWQTVDDLDLHVTDPEGVEIDYEHRTKEKGNFTIKLDVDANSKHEALTDRPQENIFCVEPLPGNYQVSVVFYEKNTPPADSEPVPFEIIVTRNGQQESTSGALRKRKESVLVKTIPI